MLFRSLNETISEIRSISVKPEILMTRIDQSEVVIEGQYCINIMGINSNTEIFCVDKLESFKTVLKNNAGLEGCKAVGEISQQKFTYNIISENKLEIKCDADVSVDVWNDEFLNVLSNIKLTESVPSKESKPPVITLYFAKCGERVWDIARNYKTSLKNICEANENIADMLEKDCVLIIPRKV